MKKILHIQSSPRSERSASIQIAETFLDEYRNENPDHIIETIDIWEEKLPEFNSETIASRYAILNDQAPSASQIQQWRRVEHIANHFKSADKYVFSLPMWNFGLPYKLKYYIDIIVQPGLAIAFERDKGFTGLITGKPAMLIFASGGSYQAGSGFERFDFQSTYLKHLLKLVGFQDISEISVEPTNGPDGREGAVLKAQPIAKTMARSF